MKKTLMLFSLCLLAGAARAGAIATQSFNYQGQLTDLADVAQSGTHAMAFELYTTLSSGSNVWSKAFPVTVTRGLFNVDLDLSGLSNTAGVLNGPLYLQVTVDGQILTPRKQVLASFFALNSDHLQGYDVGTGPNQIPVLDSSGLLPSTITTAPFPLLMSGSANTFAAAVTVFNSNAAANKIGLSSVGNAAGVSAAAGSGSGAGVLGYSAPSDTASASGIWGQAVNGVGVRASANSSNSTALQAANPAGLGLYGSGLNGGQLTASNIGLRIGGAGLGGQAGNGGIQPALGLDLYSSGQGISVANSGGQAGVGVLATGGGDAVLATNQSAVGKGVHGVHSGSGKGYGVFGESSSASGYGVWAANTGSGAGAGLHAEVISAAGVAVDALAPTVAVRAVASGSVGLTQGLLAQVNSSAGQAVHGDSSGSGSTYGLYGSAPGSVSGAGVYGTSANHGVWGASSGSGAGNYGVYGTAVNIALRGDSSGNSGSGPTGVYGSTQSNDGTGVYGDAQASGSGSAFGVQGRANAAGGTGVYGQGGLRGVAGQALGGNGHGVEGDAGPAGSGDGRVGVYGSALAGSDELVYGVYASVSGASASAYGVKAVANSFQSRAMQALNFVAQNSDPGMALDVEGKFRVGTDNANYHIESSGAALTAWNVSCNFCGTGDLVLVTPQVDITSGGTVPNSLWVAASDVHDGVFTVHSAAPVVGLRFQYLVIDK